MSGSWGPAVVIDNGSGIIKSGFAGENAPRYIYSSSVGRSTAHGFGNDKCFFGNEKRPALKLSYPIERGFIKNWEDVQLLWHNVYDNDLKVTPESRPVFLTESTLNPTSNREKMVELFMENFHVPALYVANSATMSMFAAGKTTGIVLECGAGVSTCVPMYDGVSMPATNTRLNLGGNDVTEYLMRVLSSNFSFDEINSLKESSAYVAPNYDEEVALSKDRTFHELPDKNVISLGNEKFTCAEGFFRPSIFSMNMPEEGVQKLVQDSIMKCNPEIRNDMYRNIVLAGGSTQVKGFSERLHKELTNLTNAGRQIVVSHPTDQSDPSSDVPVVNSAWVGGSIVASLESFAQSWITTSDYNEHGPGIVHRKC